VYSKILIIQKEKGGVVKSILLESSASKNFMCWVKVNPSTLHSGLPPSFD